MPTSNQVTDLRRNVQRMSKALSLLPEDAELEDGQRRLSQLDERLRLLLLTPAARLDPGLELEFYAIIESHPRLQQLSEIAFQEELVELCREGLRHYTELEKNRRLTKDEQERLSQGNKVYLHETNKLEQLIQQLHTRA